MWYVRRLGLGRMAMKKMLVKLGIEDSPSFWAFVKQFIRFGIIGAVNTALGLGLYYGLVFLGVHYILSHIIANAIGIFVSYSLNSRFTFKQTNANKAKQIIKVYAAYGITFLLGTSLLYLMVDVIGISELIAPLINLCFTVPTNFLLNKFWVFK